MEKKNKILHIANNTIGGIGTVIFSLIDTFNKSDYKSDFITIKDHPQEVFKVLCQILFLRIKSNPNKMSSNKYDLFHFHGAWTLHLILLKFVRRTKTIVSPHGAFNKVSLKKSKNKKDIATFLFMKSAYLNASCVHALTFDELEDVKDYGVSNVPIAVIPNGIDLDEDLAIDIDFQTFLLEKSRGRKVLLSLSRLHTSKGVDLLVEAFSLLNNNKDYVLFIVGDGDDNYKHHLQNLVNKCNLDNNVFMLGHRENKEKNTLYELADLFVLPSYNEGFGITVLEALRQYTPVITTTGTPFKEIPTINCGWYVAPEVETILKAIEDFDNLSNVEIDQMKNNGYCWIKDSYDQKVIDLKMHRLYNWVINEGDKPEFVYNA